MRDINTTAQAPQSMGVSRRRFLQIGGSSLLLGMYLPMVARAQSGAANVIVGNETDGTFAPNAFVRIADDDTVTVLIKHIEFGQGTYTGLATLVAEELDADWAQMRAEHAPANVELYKNLAFGIQGTGGSSAIANSYQQMRKAGAAARQMLLQAAAEAWEVDANEITIEKGMLSHASGQRSGFGALAAAASTLSPPTEPALKEASQFRLIGTDLPKLDTADKSDGKALFTLDLYRENMLTTVVLHPPKFGATVASIDDEAARALPGVVDVKLISAGVAVYGQNTYAAIRGRDALRVQWDESDAETRSTAQLVDVMMQAAQTPGNVAEVRGDVQAGFDNASTTLEADYVFPYLAHAPMEPLDAVVEATDERVDVWLGSQLQTVDHQTIAGVLQRPPEQVHVHTMLAGGSFGRRAQPASNFAAEVAQVMAARGSQTPIKHLWTREDDIRGGFYRPLTVHKMRGGLDAEGNIVSWDNTIANQSIMKGSPFEGMIQNGIDATSVEGSRDLPYDIPNLRVTLHMIEAGVPVLWWRAVGHTHTAFATETFLDELLDAAGKDPVAGRLALIDANSRDAGVLNAVAESANWGSAIPEGRARGVALHKSFGSYVAQIAEVSLNDDGQPRVHHVWCAVDCGVAVNPNVIRAQIEGGIGFGLGHALFNEITLQEGGSVVQSNFNNYRSLRINEMPAVTVTIVASGENPTGIGEPGTPPIAPAVANAMRRLSGSPVRRLPMVAV